MSTSRKQSWGAYEFTRAAYDEQRHAEREFSVWIEVRLNTTFQRGVYELVVESKPLLVQDYHLHHTLKTTFPNSDMVSFETLLYQQMYKLCRMLESAALDAQRQQAKRDDWGSAR